MKRRFLAVLLLGMTSLCAFAQTMTLDAAIASAASEIGDRLDKGTKIAVLNISSSSKQMAEYVIDALSSDIVNDGRVLVVERDQEKLGFARQELDFNDSDEVSNKSAQQIGRMLGAQSIVNGSMKVVGGGYRLTIEVLEVESSIKRYSKNFNIQNDQMVRSLMGGDANRTNLIVGSDTGDFTVAQRTGAILLNPLFGSGSFWMKDKLGGGITAGAEVAGVAMLITGIILATSAPMKEVTKTNDFGDSYKDWEEDQDQIILGTGIAVVGGVIYVGGLIFGIVRAVTFHKPGFIAAGFDPLNIGLVADRKGNPALQFSYTFKF